MKLHIHVLAMSLLVSTPAFSAFTVSVKPNSNGTMPTLTWSQADNGCLTELVEQGCPGASSSTGSCTSPSFIRFYGGLCNQISLTFQIGTAPCNLTQAEVFFMRQTDPDPEKYSTTYDVSLVNGWGGPVSITPDGGNPSVILTSSAAATSTPGVYPEGCDTCYTSTSPPCPSPHGCSTVPNPPACQYTQVSGTSNVTVNFNP